ncbi:peptidase domain-containing ABC transporter [Polynucleobacter antarcticus]|nr:ATP-binding cassette domain-containing protein [Polynucleobacter antarcticus]
MKNDTPLMGRMIQLSKKILKVVSVPILGIIEGGIAAALFTIFLIARSIEVLFVFIRSKLLPLLNKGYAAILQVASAIVDQSSRFYAFMNRPKEALSSSVAWIIQPLNLILTPVYLLAKFFHWVLVKLNDVMSQDLKNIFHYLEKKWHQLFNKYGFNDPDQATQRKKFTEKYSANALNEQCQTYFQVRVNQFAEEWKLFTSELVQLYGQTKQIFQNKKQKDSVDELSTFIQERNNIVVASVLINILALAFPLLMLQLYDRILSHRSMDTLIVFCVAVGTAVALEAVIRIFRSYSTAWISARFEHQGYVSLTSRLLAEPINDFERKGTGTILEEYKSISTLRYHYSGQTSQQLMDLPFTLLYVFIIFFISPLIGLVLMIGYSAFVFITWKNGRNYPAIIKEQKEMDLRRANLLTEILKNVHTMKSMTMESLMLRRYERLQESCAVLMSRVTYALEMSAGVGSVFSPLMTVAVIALGSWLVISNQLSNGEMAACILLGLRALSPLQRLGGMWSKHQQDEILRDKLKLVLDKPGLPAHEKIIDPNALIAEASVLSASNLQLSNVAFQFPGVQKELFDNLSLDVKAGEFIAIGGQSGSGRSALLQLMAGILEPLRGEVTLNGKNLKEFSIEDLAKEVAYLPQRTALFEGSLLDNVTVFDSSRIDIAMQVAKELGLSDFVSRMPRGWDSIVGDMAADSMPPGFRQRVAIVRALSSNPSVILFDDSSAAMDSEGDSMLLKYLEGIRGKVTIILVSERPSFTRLANRTLYLHDGNLFDNPAGNLSALHAPTSAALNPPTGLSTKSVAMPENYSPLAPGAFFEAGRQVSPPSQRWFHMGETINTNFKQVTDFSECLALLLKVINSPYSARDVAESLPYYTPGLDLTGIQNAMATLGYRVSEVPCALSAIDQRAYPCLFVPDQGAAFVVLGRIGQQLRVGESTESEPRLLSDLAMPGIAYFFTQLEKSTAKKKSWVGQTLYRFSGLIGQGSIASLISGVILMGSSLFLMAAYSVIIPSGAKETLFYLTIGAVIAVVLSYFFVKQRADILSFISGRIEYLFGTAVLQHVLALPPSFSERASVGAQSARLQIFQGIRDAFTGPLASTMLELPATLVLLIGLSIINPIALVLFLIMVAVYALLFFIFLKRTNDSVSALGYASAKRTEFLIEMITKMRNVRESGAQYMWLERMREVSANSAMCSFQAERLSSMLVGISYFVMMLSALGIVAFTTPAVFDQKLSSGALIASLLLMWRVLTPLQTLFTNMTRIERIRTAARQIDSLMQIQTERPDEMSASPVSRGLEGRLEFARASFRYSMHTDPALIGIEFKVQAGELVAITGANGSGKSTLLKLLMGMYAPQAGSILIDGVDIRQLDPLELRRIIGYAPQDTQFFRATIAQNLRFARPDATDDDVYQVLDMAGALSAVLALPNGINYRFGDNTNELPSTLKQKLLLARTYITRAPIMIFDEPGSGLDADGDYKFVETLKSLKGKTTVLFISHRPSHIRLADTLLVFDKGYLRAAGPPNELLKQPVSA